MLSFETTDTQGHPVKKRKKHLKRFLASRLKNEGSSSGDEAEGVDEGEAGEGHAPTKCTCSGDDGHYKVRRLASILPSFLPLNPRAGGCTGRQIPCFAGEDFLVSYHFGIEDRADAPSACSGRLAS